MGKRNLEPLVRTIQMVIASDYPVIDKSGEKGLGPVLSRIARATNP